MPRKGNCSSICKDQLRQAVMEILQEVARQNNAGQWSWKIPAPPCNATVATGAGVEGTPVPGADARSSDYADQAKEPSKEGPHPAA